VIKARCFVGDQHGLPITARGSSAKKRRKNLDLKWDGTSRTRRELLPIQHAFCKWGLALGAEEQGGNHAAW
jgi:hypothetical protein